MTAVLTAGAPSTCVARNLPWRILPRACILAAGAYRKGRGEYRSEAAPLARGITIHDRVTKPYRGLSRMRGNFQVRFLGGRGIERFPAYPAQAKTPIRRLTSATVLARLWPE
jgi:hypothetical protein